EPKFAHETGAARHGRFARNQPVEVPAAKRGARQFLGGGAVRFNQQGRKALPLGLIPESVDEILGWELVGGRGLITEQIVYGVVELTVRKAPQVAGGSGGATAAIRFAVFQR